MTDTSNPEPADKGGPGYADPELYRKLAGFDGDWRDTWWNGDFLHFILQRWGALETRSILDVGCGAGHWGRALLRVLPDSTTLTGIDREARFVAMAAEKARKLQLESRTDYRQATAEALPFADESFDLVTCQTVLIHVADARPVLREMARVTRKGGFVLAAEPDNLTSTASLLSIHPRPADHDLLALIELRMLCERGKAALDEGDDSIGGRLPGLFHEIGLHRVKASQNENCPLLVPPYDRGTQPVQLAMEQDLAAAGCTPFCPQRADTLRLFLAGGGREADFDRYWGLVLDYIRQFQANTAAKTLHGARGQAFYLVAGVKP